MIGRFLSAAHEARLAFLQGWHNYDVLEAGRRKLEDEVRARQSKIDLAMSRLTATDAHFVSSFLNNLMDDIPEVTQVERFIAIISTFEEPEAQYRLIQRACWMRPSLARTKPVMAWAVKNTKHSRKFASLERAYEHGA